MVKAQQPTEMNFQTFFKMFPTEEKCREHFKKVRDELGVTCKKCGFDAHYWLSTIQYFRCKNCSHKFSLRSGTVMEGSKLPYQYWYLGFMLITGTKKSFSALEVQRQISHKRYEPIWEMLHKIRMVMGQRDARYKLQGQIELDEGNFVSLEPLRKGSNGKNIPRRKKKAGRGNPRQSIVVVMAESKPNPDAKSPHRVKNSVKYIKMIKIPFGGMYPVLDVVEESITPESAIITDAASNLKRLNTVVKEHTGVNIKKSNQQVNDVLPWVHKVIANSKRNFLGIHHSISQQHIQKYLNEFCYKFNRRYNHIDVFESIVKHAAMYKGNFKEKLKQKKGD